MSFINLIKSVMLKGYFALARYKVGNDLFDFSKYFSYFLLQMN